MRVGGLDDRVTLRFKFAKESRQRLVLAVLAERVPGAVEENDEAMIPGIREVDAESRTLDATRFRFRFRCRRPRDLHEHHDQ